MNDDNDDIVSRRRWLKSTVTAGRYDAMQHPKDAYGVDPSETLRMIVSPFSIACTVGVWRQSVKA